MKWLTLGLGVLVALVGAAAAVPFFLNLGDYVPVLEKELSARLKRPVSIDELDAGLLPLPHARIDGITIGDAEEVKVRKVTVHPDLWSLFRSETVIRSIDFEDVVLTHQALAALLALTEGDRRASALRVENVRLRSALVKLERGSFGPFDADVKVSSGFGPGSLTLRTRDGALNGRVSPKGDKFELQISAKGWTTPLGPPVRFEALEISGLATQSHVELATIEARLYGGTAAGSATIDWTNGVRLEGRFDVRQVELKDAVALVSTKTRVSGRVDAKPVFSASAVKAGGLDEALKLETPFTVHDGVLHGADLAAAGSLMNQGGGGQTRFEEFAGQLVVSGRAYRFTQLRIASGSLSARGHVSIAPSRALSGRLSTSVKGVTGAGIPLIVAGTLEAPSIYPDASALAGAAAGTVLLGAGLGTAVGAKLGERADGLVGKKR